ncbi:MAG: hypothetical protein JSW54_09875 [Fidelibacterota bacterium]|nr:MAG: hypothetical protein JSW54_09875 [Candidatus Neomarinimicrobiota bacterium]
MKTYLTLLVREWREWRTVMIIVGSLYLVGMVGWSVVLHKGSNALIRGEIHTEWEDFRGFDDDDDGPEWLTPRQMAAAGRAHVLLFGWSHMLRVGAAFINVVLLVLILFYLVDAVYKERSDGSTFFYRGLPVSDMSIISSKLVAGMVGFLGISFILGVLWIYFAQITFPGSIRDLLAGADLSPYQVASLDLIKDWLVFHCLQLVWLVPFGVYFLFVSTVTRSRPLLVGMGVPILLGLFWRFLIGDDAVWELLTTNFGAIGSAIQAEWLGAHGPEGVIAGEPIQLFGSFVGYLLSLRTVISLLVAGGLFGITVYAYRRNLPVS